MNTGTLSYGDIHDKEKGLDVGVGVSVDFGGGKSADKKIDNAKNDNTKSSSKISSDSLGYGATDREQINRGTIGKGAVIVGGIKVTPGINRDEGKSQEVTKDINVDKIDVEYTADRKSWQKSDVSQIFTNYGSSLGGDLETITNGVRSIGGLKKKNYKMKERMAKTVGKLYDKAQYVPNLFGYNALGQVDELVNGGLKNHKTRAYKLLMDKNGKPKKDDHEMKIVTYTEQEYNKNAKISFLNGVLNDKNNVDGSVVNKTFSNEEVEILNKGGTVTKTYIHNESYGWLDIIEAGIDMLGNATNGLISTGNARQLARDMQKNPEKFKGMAAHSQGVAINQNALNIIARKGDYETLRKMGLFTYMGPPINVNKAKEKNAKFGIATRGATNVGDKVSRFAGGNKPNTKNFGHTNSGKALEGVTLKGETKPLDYKGSFEHTGYNVHMITEREYNIKYGLEGPGAANILVKDFKPGNIPAYEHVVPQGEYSKNIFQQIGDIWSKEGVKK